MVKLPDVTYKQFKCGFCSRIYLTELGVTTHEAKCYKNPNRNCPNCDNTGIYTHRYMHPNGKMEVITEKCRPCKMAGELGGKSYIL